MTLAGLRGTARTSSIRFAHVLTRVIAPLGAGTDLTVVRHGAHHAVRPRALHAGSKRRYPPGSAVIRGGGSLRSGPTELRYQAAWTPVSDQQILDALRVYTREHGRAPNVTTGGATTARPARR